MCNMRWTVRVVYFCIFIALISITAGAADIKKFEAPETKSIYCVDPVIILDITQYGKGFKGIKFSQKDVGIDQTLDILRKWSNPADLDEFNSTLLKKKSLSPQAQAKYIKRKKEYAKNRDFRIYSECRFIHKDEEYRCINYFVTKVIAGKDMIDNSGFVNLKKVEDQWKIASLDHVLFPFQVVFHLMPSDVFAYMVFGTEDILDQAKVKQIDKDKLINLRSRMLNSEGELNMVDFAAYIRKVQDGYQDEEMASLLINQPPQNMIIERSMGESLDEETLSIIQNDLVDLEPKLRDLVIKKLQSDGALKAIGLLRRYGGMNLKDAGELVGSWGVDKEGFTVYDSRVAAGEGIVDVELKEQVFPVFGRGPKTQIVVGMTITAYPKGATLAAADKKISALEEDEKRKIPEYILHRELELVAKGDKEGVVSLYEDEADKNFARNERWSDIEKSSSFARNKVKDYSLRTKAKFGPYVFIKYKPLLNNGEAESSSVVLKESKKGYLFSYDLVSKNQLFLIAAEAFPYWKNEKRDNVGDLSRFINTSIKYDSDAASPLADPNSTYPSMQLYCKLRRFSGENSMDASLRKRIKKQLGQLLKGYKTKNPEMIANLWSPSERTKMLNKLKLDENSMNDYAKYFKDVKSIKPEYFLKSGDVLFLYVKPISISGKPKAIELFRFKQQDDEYFLSDLESADSPYVRKILLSREFLAIIEELIKKYN